MADEARRWLREVELATGWAETSGAKGIGGLRLRFLTRTQGGDQSSQDFQAEILACAPLERLAEFLSSPPRVEGFVKELGALSIRAIDPQACLMREKIFLKDAKLPPRKTGDLNAALKVLGLFRNSANYMQARDGELVSLDPWGGAASALMVGGADFGSVDEEGFQDFCEKAMRATRAALGPACFFHMAGPARFFAKEEMIKKERQAWPATVEQWIAIAAAEREAKILDGEAVAVPGRARPAL